MFFNKGSVCARYGEMAKLGVFSFTKETMNSDDI